jgi:16S rRNA (cytosine1402-N4)-methyltransferase
LARAVREWLDPQPGETVLDATVGAGGHAEMLASAVGPGGRLVGLDVDPDNLTVAGRRLADAPCRIDLIHANFSEAADVLAALEIPKAAVILADLGVSSTQLDRPERGFSFQQDGPLDMRMDSRLGTTAADLVNRLKERELADLFYYNSQESASRRIARRICEVRREGRITSTHQLVNVIREVAGAGSGRIHPATRVFQALRIAVNREIENLANLLRIAPDLLAAGGRFGVIAFHSVEDKPVKEDFRKRKADGVYEILTKKPVTADDEERWANPRSRSAKLRVVRRCK